MATLHDRIWGLEIPPAHKLVLLAVDRMKQEGERMNMSRLARFVRVDRKTIYRITQRLSEQGHLEVSDWGNDLTRKFTIGA